MLITYYLSLGSNLGPRERTILSAICFLNQRVGHVCSVSTFYYSKPWGFESEHDFCNLCCAIESIMQPLDVLRITQSIERILGRSLKSTITGKRYTDRTIDIDLIRAFDASGHEIYCQIPNPTSEIINYESQIKQPYTAHFTPYTQPCSPRLSLPHPLWQQREFVKIPLAEIML